MKKDPAYLDAKINILLYLNQGWSYHVAASKSNVRYYRPIFKKLRVDKDIEKLIEKNKVERDQIALMR